MHETRYPDDSRHPRGGTNAIPKHPRAAKPAITEKIVRVFPRQIARLTLALKGGES